jgi:hypothetical protein
MQQQIDLPKSAAIAETPLPLKIHCLALKSTTHQVDLR